jgi:ABC-type antimicrobial peptide transport system permease subunit
VVHAESDAALLAGSVREAAAVALALAMIGVYGLVSFGVEQRVAELGIRRVLGGEDGRILGMIIGDSLRLTGFGVILGGVGALVGTRFLRAMLFGIEPNDPLTFVAVAASMLVVAALASLAPALRAMRADPLEAMRRE